MDGWFGVEHPRFLPGLTSATIVMALSHSTCPDLIPLSNISVFNPIPKETATMQSSTAQSRMKPNVHSESKLFPIWLCKHRSAIVLITDGLR